MVQNKETLLIISKTKRVLEKTFFLLIKRIFKCLSKITVLVETGLKLHKEGEKKESTKNSEKIRFFIYHIDLEKRRLSEKTLREDFIDNKEKFQGR